MISFLDYIIESGLSERCEIFEKKPSIEIGDDIVKRYYSGEKEINASARHEIAVAHTLNQMFENTGMELKAKWIQNLNALQEELLTETSNKKSDIEILDDSGNTVSTVEVKNSSAAMVYNLSIKKDTFFPGNLNMRTHRFIKMVGNAYKEIFKKLNSEDCEFRQWFFDDYLPNAIRVYEREREKDPSFKFFSIIKDIAVHWYVHKGTKDIFKMEIGNFGRRIVDYYRKEKNVNYIVFGDRMYLMSTQNMDIKNPEVNPLGLDLQILDGIQTGICSMRFKHAPSNSDYSRMISRMNFNINDQRRIRTGGKKIGSREKFDFIEKI